MAQNRDVKLTIKAKDEASATLAAVKKALEAYAAGSDKVSKSISPLGTKFKTLTDQVSKLQTEVVKSKGQIALNGQIKIVTESLSKLSQEYRVNSETIAKNKSALEGSKSALEAATKNRDAASQALAAERKALNEASAAVARHTKGQASAAEVSKKLNVEIEKRRSVVAQGKAALDQATTAQQRAQEADLKAIRTAEVLTARMADLKRERGALRGTLTGPNSMTSRSDRISGIATKTQDPWAGLAARSFQEDEGAARSRLFAYDAEIARVEALHRAALNLRNSTAEALSKQKNTVEAIQRDLVKADNLNSLIRKKADADTSKSNHAAELAKAESAQKSLTASVENSKIAVQEYSAQVVTSHNDVQKLTAETNKLEKAVSSSEAASKVAADALDEMTAAARSAGMSKMSVSTEAAEKNLLRLEERLQHTFNMAQRLSKYSDGAGGFATSGDAAKLRNLNAQLQSAQEDAAQFREEIVKLNAAISRGDGGSKELKNQIRELSQAMAVAEQDAREMAQATREIGISSGVMQRGIVDAWKKHNNEGRTALNLYQRIRGQVLSLIAAYVGLYGVASAVQQVSEAFMTQESALSRLGVVFEGNTERMGVELAWIRREAQRLGIEFGTLAGEYSKFAVSAKKSGFSEESIRKIFTSISEAGRVNKLSLEDMKGIFLATGQIISKGKVGAEELRQQMGERLPGAMTLMANAIGVTSAELDDMMKKGEVIATEETLLKFAEELDKQFGQQLPNSLRSFTAEWGRLQNTIYNAKITIGKGGLIEGLSTAMREINEYANSKEGVQFFLALGNAMGEAAKWVPVILENFESIVKVVKIILTIPIIQFFAKWMGTMKMFGSAMLVSMGALVGAPGAIRAFVAALAASTSAVNASRIAVRGLGAAMMTLGPIAAGIFVGSMIFDFFSDWKSGIDLITEAQAQHQRIMDEILTTYDEAKGKTYDWRDAVKAKNKEELASQLLPNIEAFAAANKAILDIVNGSDGLTGNFAKDLWNSTFGQTESAGDAMVKASDFGVDPKLVAKVKSQFSSINDAIVSGGMASKKELIDFRANLNLLATAIPDVEVKAKLLKIGDAIDRGLSTGDAASITITVLRELGHTVDDATGITEKFPITMEEAATGTSEMAAEMAKADAAINEKFIKPLEDALKEAGAFGDGIVGLDLEKTITDPFTGGKRSIGEMRSALEMLKGFMPSIQSAFKAFADDGALDKLEQKLGWMRFIPQLSGMLDKLVGGSLAGSAGKPLAEFESDVGKVRGQDIEQIVQASNLVAKQLGISAKDILTVIGYETGGTYDKWQKGGAGGKYRGLIQFSPENQAQYGLSETSSIAEQFIGIAKYLQDRGVKPGMGILEIYAAINAGHVSKVNASDAANGGLPGTVRDKVYSPLMQQHASTAEGLIDTYADATTRGELSGDAILDAQKEAEKKAEADAKAAQAKKDELAAVTESLGIEQLRVDGKEREAFIQEKINAFTEKHGEMSKEELDSLRDQYGKMYDLQQIKSKDEQLDAKIKEHQEEINRLESERNALLEQREIYKEKGDSEKVSEIDGKLIDINAELQAAIDGFITFWQASKSPEAAAGIANLEAMKLKLKETGKEAILTASQVNERFADGIADSFGALAEALARGENAFGSMRDAFLNFAGDFLIEIGKMIVRQTMLNALQNGGGAGGGFGGMIMGALSSVTTGIFHTGKGAGQTMGTTRRTVPASLFSGAQRFHTGKMPGLRSGEMAAIITEDEEVLPPTDPRHSWNLGNGGGAAPAMPNMSIINTFDVDSMAQAVLSAPASDKVFLNKVKALAPQIKKALQ